MNRRRKMTVAVAFATILNAVAYGSDRMTMRAPPSTMDRSERVLSSREAAKSPCTNLARSIAGATPGIVMRSEKVSRSDDFGYVYRYRIVQSIEHEGKIVRSRSVLVVWSKNCETAQLATYSMFRLPSGPRPR
jgi:hypothetical protein